jgi:hypothetical protein
MTKLVFMLTLLSLLATGCGGAASSEVKPEQWRTRLHGAMHESVATRDKRDELSRLLVDAIDAGALDRLTRPDIEAAFGPALACQSLPLCAEQGFQDDDWYYLIGTAADPKIKQLPVLIIGFDTHNQVSRVYTLRTH